MSNVNLVHNSTNNQDNQFYSNYIRPEIYSIAEKVKWLEEQPPSIFETTLSGVSNNNSSHYSTNSSSIINPHKNNKAADSKISSLVYESDYNIDEIDLFYIPPSNPISESHLLNKNNKVQSLLDYNVEIEANLENGSSLYSTQVCNQERCLICTLPIGTCIHSQQWMVQKEHEEKVNQFALSVEDEIENSLNFFKDPNEDALFNSIIEASYQTIDNEQPDIESMNWKLLEERPVDSIGRNKMILSSPGRRVWHSTTRVGEYLVVFGGLRTSDDEFNFGFESLNNSSITLLNDICVYDPSLQAWLQVNLANEIKPEPRYGHSIMYLDSNHFILYGGRGELGKIFDDTWIFSFLERRWKQVNYSINRNPGRRLFFSLATIDTKNRNFLLNNTIEVNTWDWKDPNDLQKVKRQNFNESNETGQNNKNESELTEKELIISKVTEKENNQKINHDFLDSYEEIPPEYEFNAYKNWNRIILYGGTDNENIFGDLWLLQCSKGQFFWELLPHVGKEPLPRYGHQLVVVDETKYSSSFHLSTTSSNTCKLYLIILGGCCTSPIDETVGTNASLKDIQNFINNSSYETENNHIWNKFISEEFNDSIKQINVTDSNGNSINSSIFSSESLGQSIISINKSTRAKNIISKKNPHMSFIESLKVEDEMFENGLELLNQSIKNNKKLLKSNNYQFNSLSNIPRKAALLTAAIQRQTEITRKAEEITIDSYKKAQAFNQYKLFKSKHPFKLLDVYYYDLENGCWFEKKFPKLTGEAPSARMHFSCELIFPYIVIIGGCFPTSNYTKHVDQLIDKKTSKELNIKDGEGKGKLYMFNFITQQWNNPMPINSYHHLDHLLSIAKTDLYRARQKVRSETYRGISYGVTNGMTKEKAQAIAYENVCQWRVDIIENEIKNFQKNEKNLNKDEEIIDWNSKTASLAVLNMTLQEAYDKNQVSKDIVTKYSQGNTICGIGRIIQGPCSSFGSTFTRIGHRLVFIGGIGIKNGKGINPLNTSIVLDFENNVIKKKRERNCYYSLLERDRKIEEMKYNIEKLISLTDLKLKNEIFLKNLENERKLMKFNDYYSSLPPLSKPPPLKFLKSNHNTIWLTWDRIHFDSLGNHLDKNSKVIYYLYVHNSFELLNKNDEVLVLPKNAKSVLKKLGENDNRVSLNDENESSKKENEENYHEYRKHLIERINKVPPSNNMTEVLNHPSTLFFDDTTNRFAGHIIKECGEGFYNIKYTDGSIETYVPRCRIKLNKTNNNPKMPLTPQNFVPNSSNNSTVSSVIGDTNLFNLDSFNTVNDSLSTLDTNSIISYSSLGTSSSKQKNNLNEGSYISSNISFTTATEFKPTVVIPPNYELLYAGPYVSSYACAHLIPYHSYALKETNAVHAMKFILQIQGVDYPKFERSQLSTPLICLTNPTNYLNESKKTVESVDYNEELRNSTNKNNQFFSKKFALPDRVKYNSESYNININTDLNNKSGSQCLMSKTRREIITAVVSGHQLVTLEKRNNSTFISEGQGEEYM